MLTDEEREELMESTALATRYEDSSRATAEELVVYARLVEQQRVQEIEREDDDWIWTEFHATDWGHKALRIDALIRQWGYRP